MSATPTPAVVPILVYEDIEAAHDFLVGTFGLTSGGLHRLDDGTVVHGEVRNGGAPHLDAPGRRPGRNGLPASRRHVPGWVVRPRPGRRRALRPREGGRGADRARAHGPALRPARVRRAGPREPPLVVLVTPGVTHRMSPERLG